MDILTLKNKYKAMHKDSIDVDDIQRDIVSYIEFYWERSSSVHKDPTALLHFNPRHHIKRFSDNNEFYFVNPYEALDKSKKPPKNKKSYPEFALSKDGEEYSMRMEDFLSKIENHAQNLLVEAGMSRNSTIIDNHLLFGPSSQSMYFKIVYSVFLSIQWYRTPYARERLLKSGLTKNFDDQILEGAKDYAIYLFCRQWVWFHDIDMPLWLSVHPFYLYPKKLSEIPLEYQSNFNNGLNPENVELVSIPISSTGLYAVSKHLLLYIKEANEPFIWMPSKSSGITTNIDTSSFRTENSSYPMTTHQQVKLMEDVLLGNIRTDIFVYLNRNLVIKYEKPHSFVSEKYPNIIKEAVSEQYLKLSEFLFSHYNYLVAQQSEKVYLDDKYLDSGRDYWSTNFNIDNFFARKESTYRNVGTLKDIYVNGRYSLERFYLL